MIFLKALLWLMFVPSGFAALIVIVFFFHKDIRSGPKKVARFFSGAAIVMLAAAIGYNAHDRLEC